MSKAKILITGGAGYIGSTIVMHLQDHGYTPIVLDSLVYGERTFVEDLDFYQGDIADTALLKQIFSEHPTLDTVIHLAAHIDVAESVQYPALYYRENVCKSLTFAETVLQHGIQHFVFSSTAAVYAGGNEEGLSEDSGVMPQNPYARSKLMFEQILHDLAKQHDAAALVLRYFNPIGADPLMRSGPYRPDPTHVMGKLVEAARREDKQFTIFGGDYPTRDGTAVRDYVHVADLARAHVLALDYLETTASGTMKVFNLGYGQGVTVRELTDAFMRVRGEPLNIVVSERRPGDNAGAFASPQAAREQLGWVPEFSLERGIADALRWEQLWRQKQEGSA